MEDGNCSFGLGFAGRGRGGDEVGSCRGVAEGPDVADPREQVLADLAFRLGLGPCARGWQVHVGPLLGQVRNYAGRFFDAFREGDVDGLRELLAADVRMVGDSGGKAPQWGNSILGVDNVARMLAAIASPFIQIGGVVQPHEVNGQPGAIFRDRDGKVVNALALDILDGQIQTIRSVINPDKLGHVGPVADAWAVVREATRVRRSQR